MIALIDGDIVAYRCAASAENEPEDIAILRTDRLIREILEVTRSETSRIYLSGSSNFRYDLYPEYKANRKGKPEPKHRDACETFLCREWNATVTDGYEADDALGIEQTKHNVFPGFGFEPVKKEGGWYKDSASGETTICSADKDLLQVPGCHYNLVKKTLRFIDTHTGWFHFYQQMVLGDKADNVFGYDGKARDKIPQFLQSTMDELYEFVLSIDMDAYVSTMYDSPERFEMNKKVLWILRQEPNDA